MKLDPFYPIVDSADWVQRLVPLGVKLVQLRIKDRTGDVLRTEIRMARDVCAVHGCRLIVNDHWQMAIEEGCDFVHLGQEDLADADLAAIRKAGLKLGLSTHDGAELDTALSAAPDYIALGPVFPTSSKELAWLAQGVDKVADWKAKIGGLPLVAIGGITLETAPDVLAKGADTIAVISDVVRNDDPEARTRDWIKATQPWR